MVVEEGRRRKFGSGCLEGGSGGGGDPVILLCSEGMRGGVGQELLSFQSQWEDE